MNLIYYNKYEAIDKRMSECEIGGQRDKGCKHNLFLLNGLIHEVKRSKKNKPIVIQFYDCKQMFVWGSGTRLQEHIAGAHPS